MKKLVFKNGIVNIDFDKAITVHADLEKSKTFLELPGIPLSQNNQSINQNNYRFLLADDHKGNKALTIVKGNLTSSLVNHSGEIIDPNFTDVANRLINLFNQIQIKSGEK